MASKRKRKEYKLLPSAFELGRPPKESLLTSHAFAKACGCSIKTIKRYIEAGFIAPAHVHDTGKSGSRRIFFRPTQVAEMQRALGTFNLYDASAYGTEKATIQAKSLPRVKGGYTGAEAQIAFKMLAEGAGIRDIVKEHGIHPDAVAEIQQTYARVEGGFFITKPTIMAIGALPLDGPLPAENEADLLKVLELAAAPRKCVSCKKAPRRVCEGCVQTKAKEAADARETALVEGAKAEIARMQAEHANNEKNGVNGAAKPAAQAPSPDDVPLPEDEAPGR